jgi:O-antigen/teichoic acid export membrane protein
MAVYVVGTIIISRLLSPAQIGTFAIAAGFFAIASSFRDFGVSEFLIQSKRLSIHRLRLAATANVATSWAMAVLLALGAAPIAQFYRSTDLQNILYMLAFNFLIIPFGAIGMAYYRRELDFRPMLMASVGSSVVGLIVTLLAIHYGLGVYALALGAVSGVMVTVLVSIAFRPKWFPWRPAFRGIFHVFGFGGTAMGIYLCQHLSKSAPDLVNGRAFGPTETAIFSRGAGIVEIISRLALRPIDAVCLPHFAKVRRDGGCVSSEYERLVCLITVVGWPTLAFTGAFASPLVHTVFGNQWRDSVPLAQLACVAMAFELVHFYAREVMIALGRVDLAFKLQWQCLLLRAGALLIGAQFGLVAVAYALIASAVISLVVIQIIAMPMLECTLWRILKAMGLSGLTSLVVFVFCLGARSMVDPAATGVVALALIGFGAAIAWLLCIRYTKHPIYGELLRITARVHGVLRKWRRVEG